MKITEAAGVGQGTFYLYFASKKEIFDELVRDLNRRVRHAMNEASSQGDDARRAGAARLRARTSASPPSIPALYRIIRQAEFVSPEMLRCHYDQLSERLRRGRCARRSTRGELGDIDPEVAAWALMAVGELIGMRWILWGDGEVPAHVEQELGADHPLRPGAAQ